MNSNAANGANVSLRIMTVERDLAAHVASCRDCRRQRERWEGGMALEFAEFRASVVAHIADIGKQLVAGMTKLEKRLDSHKQKSKRA